MLEARLASPIFTIVVRRSGRRSPSRPLSSARSPSRAIPPFRRAEPTTPADQTGARVDCFPAHAAFPKWQEGRHPAERKPPPPIAPERKPPPPIPPPRKPPPPKPPPWKPPPPPPWQASFLLAASRAREIATSCRVSVFPWSAAACARALA